MDSLARAFTMPRNGVLLQLLLLLLLLHGSLVVLVAGKSISQWTDVDQNTKVPFTLEETYNQTFLGNNFNGTWRKGNEFIYSDYYAGDVLIFDVETGISSVLMEYSVVEEYDKATVSFSFDSSHVLINYDYTSGFRYSLYKRCVVYNIKTRRYSRIANGDRIALAKWSPTKNALIYIKDNDIYYEVFTNTETVLRTITNTGELDKIYNGIPDWVYEEEILASPEAIWFSPDGRHLAFATFNDSNVKDMVIQRYGEPGSLKDQYPQEIKIKYPKAGTRNPIVSLSLVELDNLSSKLVNLEAPTNVVGVDKVLYTVNWRKSGEVIATWTNRVQNKAQLVLYDTNGNANNILYQEETDGWLRIQPPVYHNRYVIVANLQDSGTTAGKFQHLTRFEYQNGKLTNEVDLTPGTGEIISILSVDHVRERVYYLGTELGNNSQRHLYSVHLQGNNEPVCLSCNVITPEGNRCTYAAAYFSTDSSNYALSCSGPDPVYITIMNADHKLLYVWDDNQALREKVANRTQPLIHTLYVTKDDYKIKVKLTLPPDFDERKSYPLLINVYAGPNTIRITDEPSYGFDAYLVTNRSVIYGRIDGRGSAYKGSKMLYVIYRKLGTVEIEDQIYATEVLQKTYPWIDANRTAIWGWSYGGFSTAMVLATDNKSVFKCGISVAPVTSFIYYDSLYTERYMGLPTPEDNLHGYNCTDVSRRVEGIRGKKYMLIHGTGDDNVHYQQAMALNKALVDKDIMFEEQSYTDEVHALSGVSPHLYHTMDRFWANCFGY